MSIIGRLRPYSIVVFVLGPRLGHFSFPDTVATEDSTVDSFLKCPPSSDLFHFHWSDIGWPKQESVILPCVQWERELEYLWVAVFSNRASPVCWAAVYGVAQSWTRLMQLSSSSSSLLFFRVFWLLFRFSIGIFELTCLDEEIKPVGIFAVIFLRTLLAFHLFVHF